MNTQIDNILHRDELNRQLGELKACHDGLLLDYIKRHPEMGYGQIGDKFGLVGEHVSLIARKNNIRRLRGRKKTTGDRNR